MVTPRGRSGIVGLCRPAQAESSQRGRIISSLVLCGIGLALAGYTLWVHCASRWPGMRECRSRRLCGGTHQRPVSGDRHTRPRLRDRLLPGSGSALSAGGLAVPRVRVHVLRLAVAAVGIVTVLYLISTELFTVKKICLWCTGVHLVTFALFVIVATATPLLLERTRPHS